MNKTQSSAQNISVIAQSAGIPEEAVLRYGHDKAKIDLHWLSEQKKKGKLVLVTAISPTPPGEGKTTTSIGLADGLRTRGVNSVLALREPSMGPVFGMKGGATGGGKATIVPESDINLHFTGDFAAIAEANNLLAALIDNHIHFGNQLGIDTRAITWRRAIDVNDRSLRHIITSVGPRGNGVLAETGFDITAASQIMAVFCLATSLENLEERLGNLVIGQNYDGTDVTVRDLKAEKVLAAVLKDALSPNLVQSLEGTPTFIHGGPFANIAHGCNSVIATQAALALGDVAITEAGFGADLGAEKFIDLKCRKTGLAPDLTVVVATVRALKYHGGVKLDDLTDENVQAVADGSVNLLRHVKNLQDVFNQKVVVAINKFDTDTEAEIAEIKKQLEPLGVTAVTSTHFADGGAGAADLADVVMAELDKPAQELTFAYKDSDELVAKAEAVATKIYHAGKVTWAPAAKKEIARLQKAGYGDLPICIAKTQYSFATTTIVGAPEGHEIEIREVRLNAGAGFVVLIAGSIMTMPGLPKVPASENIEVVDGQIVGIS